MKLLTQIGIVFTGAALLVGCQTAPGPEVVKFDEFPDNYKTHSNADIANAQAAVGNRHDATLRPAHFDGGKLNSLGQAKLDSMLQSDKSNDRVTIYVDVPADEAAPRKSAVAAFLKTRGLKEAQVALKDGSNPEVGGMAAHGLAGLEKMDQGGGESSAKGGSMVAK